MNRSWTFGRKLGMGFALVLLLAAVMGAVAIVSLRSVVESKDAVIATYAQDLIDAAKLDATSERMVATSRGILISGDSAAVARFKDAKSDFDRLLARLGSRSTTEEERRLLDDIDRAQQAWQTVAEQTIARKLAGAPLDELARTYDEQLQPLRTATQDRLETFVNAQELALTEGTRSATETSSFAVGLVLTIVAAVAIVGIVAAVVLTRGLTRQIGGAVQHVQSSASELQAAANQQATGAKEQATAMNEITTTINELLATSRQIAQSAQRVADMAEQAVSAAGSGDQTVLKGREGISGIKRQVDQIVTHMLDLGRKAQQIGGILEIINELAEQTNILSINASIEAAGAGDAGKRFAVVADEIRKLADRVGNSTKEIRELIDETRAAVNTTVMATESGSKAVDAGMQQFADVAAAFQQIVEHVRTATEAAREIELSTKQQATAVEQVNVAFADVAQTTNEMEASSGQTFQTAAQLTDLARDLNRFVQPRSGV